MARLCEAAALAPRDAAIASDLAAAYLVRAQRLDSPPDLLSAVDQAQLAVSLSPQCQEARFNLALALEAVNLRSAARSAWQYYVNLDPRSPWTKEAQRHLSALTQPDALARWPAQRTRLQEAAASGDATATRAIVAQNRQATRLYVEEEILPEWARRCTAGQEMEAGSLLRVASSIGEALRALGGDSLVEKVVDGVKASPSNCGHWKDPPVAAAALVDFGRGLDAYRRNDLVKAQWSWRRASGALRTAENPFRGEVDLDLASLHYQRADYRGALAALRQIHRTPNLTVFPSLQARAWWIEGLCDEALAHPVEAHAAFRRSLAGFTAAGESEGVTAVHGLLATALTALGDRGGSWRERYAALRGIPELLSYRRRNVVLGAAAVAALEDGHLESARRFQDAAVEYARLSANPLDLAEALRVRAGIGLRGDDLALARADLAQAADLVRHFGEALRQELRGELLATESKSLPAADPRRAELLQQAIAVFRQGHDQGALASAYLDLAVADQASGAERRAEADLRVGIALQEQEWSHAVEASQGHSGLEAGSGYFRRRRELFERLALLEASRGDTSAALDVSEQAHSWELLLQLLEVPGAAASASLPVLPTPPPAEIARRRLPPHTVVVEYRFVGDTTLSWVITRGGISYLAVKVRRADIARLAAWCHPAASEKKTADPFLAALEELHSLLVLPLQPFLRPGDELVFIPDGPLAAVPFAALRDRASGRFLVEDFAVAVAPSLRVLLDSQRRDRMLAGYGRPTVLAVHEPRLDRELFPDLGALPGAAQETAALAEIYGAGSETLSGRDATSERLLSAIGRHAVLHLAGHAVIDNHNPLASVLPLAPGASDRGTLYAYQLLGHRFARTRLVILAACDTAGGQGAQTERISGFVRPLLADGVPTVIASLWPVGDEATARLFQEFHRHFRAGASALQALRAAQLTLLADLPPAGRSPAQWAGFEVFGGSVPGAAATLGKAPTY